MAAYPTYGQLLASEIDGDGGIVLDRAQDGTTRGRAFYPATKRAFTVRHLLSAAELVTLHTFYETNKLVTFSFAWTGPDSGTYTCFFAGRPKARALGPDAFEVEARLQEQ